MTAAAIISAAALGAAGQYQPPREPPRTRIHLVPCKYCGVTDEPDHGTCRRCGAPLELEARS